MHQTAVNRATNMMMGSCWVYFEAGHGAYNAPYPSNDGRIYKDVAVRYCPGIIAVLQQALKSG